MKLSIIPSEQYPRHELEVQDWLAKDKGFYNQFKSGVTILNTTEKAYQIELEKSGEIHWIPKSQCKLYGMLFMGVKWTKKHSYTI